MMEAAMRMVYDALAGMNVDPDGLTFTPLQCKDGVYVYRCARDGESFVLKCFTWADDRREIRNYSLLRTLGVPTLGVLGATESALMLEDLGRPDTVYRLGTEADMQEAAVGRALGVWYQALHGHGAGSRALGDLYSEVEEIDEPALRTVMRRSGTARSPLWQPLMDNLGRVLAAVRALPMTLTYNDFHWSNLAVARDGERALMFDYNLLGRGYRYADLRNVRYGLSPKAWAAFEAVYGAPDAREALLDDVLAPLYSLIVAYRRPVFPDWAEPEAEMLENGLLADRVQALLAAL